MKFLTTYHTFFLKTNVGVLVLVMAFFGFQEAQSQIVKVKAGSIISTVDFGKNNVEDFRNLLDKNGNDIISIQFPERGLNLTEGRNFLNLSIRTKNAIINARPAGTRQVFKSTRSPSAVRIQDIRDMNGFLNAVSEVGTLRGQLNVTKGFQTAAGPVTGLGLGTVFIGEFLAGLGLLDIEENGLGKGLVLTGKGLAALGFLGTIPGNFLDQESKSLLGEINSRTYNGDNSIMGRAVKIWGLGVETPSGFDLITPSQLNDLKINIDDAINKGQLRSNFQLDPDFENGVLIAVASSDQINGSNAENLDGIFTQRTDFVDLYDPQNGAYVVSYAGYDFFARTKGISFTGDANLTTDNAVKIIDNPFDGVDFTNLKVAGLDFDDTTEQIQFVLEGDKKTSNASNKQAILRPRFFKKVFLQALAVPKRDLFVSLEKDANENGVAIATNGFKKTDMAPIFFEADEQLKFQFFKRFTNRPGEPSLWLKWLQLLTDSAADREMFFDLVLREKDNFTGLPNINVRFVIVPELPVGNGRNGNFFLRNSRLGLVSEFTERSLTLGGQSYNAAQRAYINRNFNTFKTYLNGRLSRATTDVLNWMRTSQNIDVKRLREIFPVIVAAQWYKEFGEVSEPLKEIVDSYNFSDVFTGYPFEVNTPFNQNIWNQRANQVLGRTATGKFTTENKDFKFSQNIPAVTVTGGVNSDIYNFSNINNNNLSATQRTILNKVPSTDQFAVGGTGYVNGGGVNYNLPELVATAIFLPKEVNQFERIFPNFVTVNTGTKKATNVAVETSVKKVGTNTEKSLGAAIFGTLDQKVHQSLIADFIPTETGQYEFTFVVNRPNNVREVTKKNNTFSRRVTVKPYTCPKEDIQTYVEDLRLIRDDFLGTGNVVVTLDCEVSQNSQLDLASTRKIVLGANTRIKEGSRLTAKITTCSDMRNRIRNKLINNNDNNTLASKSRENTNKRIEGLMEKRNIQAETTKLKPNDFMVDQVRNEMNEILDGTFRERRSDNTKPSINIFDAVLSGSATSVSDVNIYPNPIENDLKLEIELLSRQKISLEIWDMTGRKIAVLANGVTVDQGTQQMEFTMGQIKQGAYILKINLENGDSLSKVILKR